MAKACDVVASTSIAVLFSPHGVKAFRTVVDPAHLGALVGGERQATSGMAAGRAAEFAAGRACVHAALGEFGHRGPVLRGERGAPIWPAGITGSITHTKGLCVGAAAQRSETLAAIGLDVEQVDRVRPNIARRILTASELADFEQIAEAAPDAARRRLALAFAAKEAFYKAHYQIDARYLGFHVVEVADCAPGELSFSVGDGSVDPGVLKRSRGRYIERGGRVLVAVDIAPPR